MWSAMSSNEDVFVDGNEEGVGRVRKGNYAFLVESKYQEFIDKRDPCDTIKVHDVKYAHVLAHVLRLKLNSVQPKARSQ